MVISGEMSAMMGRILNVNTSNTKQLIPVTETEGSYQWNCLIENKISEAKNEQGFRSIDFKMANLTWRLEIYPNGQRKDRIGSFDIYLSLLKRPKRWKKIIATMIIQSPQTKSSFVGMPIFEKDKMNKTWPNCSLSLSEFIQSNLEHLSIKVFIKIQRVILDNKTIHFQSKLEYKPKQTISYHIDKKIIKKLKNSNHGKLYYSPIINQMFAIGIYPNGVGWVKSTIGQCYLFLRLCALPEGITNMNIKYTVYISDLSMSQTKTKEFTLKSNDDGTKICSFVEFQSLSDLSITIDLEILEATSKSRHRSKSSWSVTSKLQNLASSTAKTISSYSPQNQDTLPLPSTLDKFTNKQILHLFKTNDAFNDWIIVIYRDKIAKYLSNKRINGKDIISTNKHQFSNAIVSYLQDKNSKDAAMKIHERFMQYPLYNTSPIQNYIDNTISEAKETNYVHELKQHLKHVQSDLNDHIQEKNLYTNDHNDTQYVIGDDGYEYEYY